MAFAEIKEVLSVDRDQLFRAIIQYENYPKFVEGCKMAQIVERSPGKARVKYHVSVMRDIEYTLDLQDDAEKGTVDWTLLESDFFKKNIGHWVLKSVGPGKTEAYYSVEIEFKIMVPNMILNKIVKSSLPSMLKNFEKYAQTL
jgi:ribosome-associated toxin RatA of RatAB toxin-antitoxin module